MTYLGKKYKITGIKNYTDDVKLFKISSSINPKPGQFLEVSLPGIGECPLASCSNNPKILELLTKCAGNVTSAMFNLKKGDEIFIRGPYGKGFPINKFYNKNLLLFAGGTGIAPITSLINHIEKNIKKFKKITIYFGFKNSDYILLKDRINEWNKKFNVTVCMDSGIPKSKKPSFKYEIGFINKVLEKKQIDIKDTIAVMCGPEPMMYGITSKLNELGLKNNKIYWSIERRMECGIGNCNRCLIQDLYVCKDGPVFRYDIIKPRLDNEKSAQE